MLELMVMRLLPDIDALSAMMTLDERDVGVLGPAGMVEARFDDIVE